MGQVRSSTRLFNVAARSRKAAVEVAKSPLIKKDKGSIRRESKHEPNNCF